MMRKLLTGSLVTLVAASVMVSVLVLSSGSVDALGDFWVFWLN